MNNNITNCRNKFTCVTQDNGYHLKQKYREIEPDDSHQICLDPPGCFSSTCVFVEPTVSLLQLDFKVSSSCCSLPSTPDDQLQTTKVTMKLLDEDMWLSVWSYTLSNPQSQLI